MLQYVRSVIAARPQRDVLRGRLQPTGVLMHHIPVMIDEVQRYLLHKHSRLILDGTTGCGGHARAILACNPNVELIGVDWDADALDIARNELESFAPRARLIRASYSDVAAYLGATDMLDGALLDLGLSSLQLDLTTRGFGYQKNGPLDMRMSGEGTTAAAFIQTSSGDELRRVLIEYGEVTRAGRIARAIKKASDDDEMSTTFDLKNAVESALGGTASPAMLSRVFQGIRIAVNGELGNINTFLNAVIGRMNEGGRIVVISYQSLEDRLVKNFFKLKSSSCVCPPGVPLCVCGQVPTLKLLTRRVVKPSAAEVASNPRSRSARLRAVQIVNTVNGE
ncbi:MAG: 16S rRNA (cytosine(1402)-N(4))-methyltransferase RsmH [Candidatus Latescibacterota bacterium]|nr:MAG: 16S rRNA (cytosine(1402)-N(4))-methyltransferase RsmH [Candidatus Latescibacterota bacterium]